jgi:predicted hydrocarbon binding protein
MTKPKVFNEEDTESILEIMSEKLSDDVNADVVQPISMALQRIKEVYAHLALLPGVPRVTMRTETLQTLLNHLGSALSDNFVTVLKEAGNSIGQSFAEDFVTTLKRINIMPYDLNALIKIWLNVESNARWGIFDVKKTKENQITIYVEDLFLTRGLSEDIHRNCSFMEGYIEGFLWETTKTCARWYEKEYGLSDKNRFPEPISVKDTTFGSKCKFEVLLKQEELVEAFDEFYEAKLCCVKGDYRRVALSLRTALELAFKAKVGIASKKQVPVTSIISEFRNLQLLPAPPYRTVKDVYGRTSAIIHGSIRKPAKNDVEVLVSDTGYILKVLELMKLKEEEKKDILLKIENRKS